MSEGYETDAETALVTGESNYYDVGLDTAIALTLTTFFLGVVTLVDAVGLTTSGSALGGLFLALFAAVIGGVGTVGLASYLNVVPIVSQRVRGIGLGLLGTTALLTLVAYALDVTLAALLGTALLAEAAVLLVAGIASYRGVVDTTPSRSAGLAAGVAFGFLGLLLGSVLGGTLVGFDSGLWIAVALLGGVGLAAVTILPREDLGSSLAATLFVGLLGITITAVMPVDWTLDLSSVNGDLDGGFTGGIVIPLFVVFGSLLSSWGIAKARAGYGAQGRQYGAFLLINMNAFLMVAIMASIVFFVVSKGVVYAFHGFSVGALTLLVLIAPLLVVALGRARRPAGTGEWHSAARQFFRVLPVAALGSLASVLAGIILTGSTISVDFQYTTLQNRVEVPVDTSLAITPSLEVGAWLVFLPAAILFGYWFRKVATIGETGDHSPRLAKIKQAISVFVTVLAALVVVMAVFGKAPWGIPLASILGSPLTYVGGVVAVAVLSLPLRLFVAGDRPLAERAVEQSDRIAVGVYGGLAVLLATALLETASGAFVGAGPFALVTTVSFYAIGVCLVLSGVLLRAYRTADTGIEHLLRSQVSLALAGVAGFVAVMALHVAFTDWAVNLAGLSIDNGGSLSWPFVMESRINLAPDNGGIFPAIVGTVWLVIGASLFAIPLGVGAAVFLTEYAEQGYFTGLVEVATNALWSTPSVVFGLFGAAFLLPRFGNDTSLIAGQLVLGFMLLPLVLITSREAIKSVPDEYRDASAALGVSRWETIRSVVLPAAMPGVITGVILGVGRIAGETAPLILVLGSALSAPEPLDVLGGFQLLGEAPFVFNDALLAETPALPTGIWAVITAGVSGSQSRGWATAFILLTVVLLFYSIGIASRTYFRRKLNYE